MGDDEGAALSEHPPQHPTDGRGDGDVERGERFVEEQECGVRREGAGNGDPLCLASRELGGVTAGEVVGVDLAQPRVRDLAGPHSRRPRAARAERDILEHRQVREQERLLGQERDPAPVRRRPPGVRSPCGQVEQHGPVELAAPAVGTDHAGDRVEQGGLARTVRSDHRDGLTGGDLEAERDVAGGQADVHGEAHPLSPRPVPVPVPLPVPEIPVRNARVPPDPCASVTMTIATTTSTRESATAVSGSVSRCR